MFYSSYLHCLLQDPGTFLASPSLLDSLRITLSISTTSLIDPAPNYPSLNTVIHIILSPEAGVSEIPKVLRGEISTNSHSQDQAQIGTKNYSTSPAAVILGGAYDDAAIESMREACKGCDAKIPWLRADVSKPSPPLGPAYGPHIVGRAKECMKELVEKGKLEGDGVYYY
jgi:hypothetical protein